MTKQNKDDETAFSEKEKVAYKLFLSERGLYLVGQAFAIAAPILKERGDVSNAKDMELLGQTAAHAGYAKDLAKSAE